MIDVPRPMMVNTGEEHKITGTIDDFLGKTARYVMGRYAIERFQLSIDSGEVSYGEGTVPSNRITHLMCEGRVLAGVFEYRTLHNRVAYTFFESVEVLDGLGVERR